MPKTALITSVNGQDSFYLTQLLLKKNYTVHGLIRPGVVYVPENFGSGSKQSLLLHQGDLASPLSIIKMIEEISPDEIYNLGAQSQVALSFELPEYTANINALGALRILEAIRILNLTNKTRVFQASSAELFGKVTGNIQNENTPFYPQSPYAVSKLFAYWTIVNYREAYNLYACNGILYNHESPRRGEMFVTRKITQGLAKIKLGRLDCLYLGNLDAMRDWGHAKDYVEMQWLMLQQDHAEDFVIATGIQHSVKDFIKIAAEVIDLKLHFEGEGLQTKAFDHQGICRIQIDPQFFRPTESAASVGDASKAEKKLGWTPKINFHDLVKEMAVADLELIQL